MHMNGNGDILCSVDHISYVMKYGCKQLSNI